MPVVASWSVREPRSPFLLSGGGFAILGVLPWLFPSGGAGKWGSVALFVVGLVLLLRFWPRRRLLELELNGDGLVYKAQGRAVRGVVGLELATSRSFRRHPSTRFELRGKTTTGEDFVIDASAEPEELFRVASLGSALVPLSTTWGSGDLAVALGGSLPSPARFRCHARSSGQRVARILMLLAAILAAAWTVLLWRATSPGLRLSATFAIVSWLCLVVIIALCVRDDVEIELGRELRVRRIRLYGTTETRVAWESISRLEILEDQRAEGTLFVVTENLFSVPIDTEGKRKLRAALRPAS